MYIGYKNITGKIVNAFNTFFFFTDLQSRSFLIFWGVFLYLTEMGIQTDLYRVAQKECNNFDS